MLLVFEKLNTALETLMNEYKFFIPNLKTKKSKKKLNNSREFRNLHLLKYFRYKYHSYFL